MPTYDYDCPSCGGFDAFRSLSERNEPAACPDCAALRRACSSAPAPGAADSGARNAIGVNERARHEPHSGQLCPHGYSGARLLRHRAQQLRTAPNGAKAFLQNAPG
jgi:putative FmdB family regulatory protein